MNKLNRKWLWVCLTCLVLIVGLVVYKLVQSSIPVPLDSAGKTPDAVAKAWFSALSAGDANVIRQIGSTRWEQPDILQRYEGLQVISIGTPFPRPPLPQWFVSYEIRLKSGEVKRGNLAVKIDNPGCAWHFDGGL
ncbi:MAG: hypothetical protein NT018_10015 [Armatimonadetes bacterium]|nr:hypothetical protein [Armatimonadota bacterium]